MYRLLAVLALVAWAGCRAQPPSPEPYVARVGPSVLTEEDLAAALAVVPAGVDSLTAREQFVEQWVTAELMAREAEARGLRDRPDVQRQLAENERSVLAAALLGVLYEEAAADVPHAELEEYFDRNRDRLRLREPYVRVRLLEAATEADAEAARAALQEAMQGARQDSLWEAAARAYAVDTTLALALGRAYVPESRLRGTTANVVGDALGPLGPGQIAPVIEADGAFYVVQLLDRAPAGALPELGWIEDEVRRQIAIQSRKQLLARHVQRLRTQAEARGDLELRTPDDAASLSPADSLHTDSLRTGP